MSVFVAGRTLRHRLSNFGRPRLARGRKTEDFRLKAEATSSWLSGALLLNGWLSLPRWTVVLAGCSAPAAPAPDANDVDAVLAKVDAAAITAGARVRIAGIVTDDDVERRLAFVAGRDRAIAVRTGEAGLGVPPGRRVILDARVEKDSSGLRLIDPIVVRSEDAMTKPVVIVDAGELLDRGRAGRRIELLARVQGAAAKDGRLQLTITADGMQLEAEVRRPLDLDKAALVGSEIRLRGIMVAGAPVPRMIVPSAAACILATNS